MYYRNVALPAMERGEAWHWTLRLKTNPGQLIGSISLMRSAEENRGFWLGIPWQRQGLISEACETVTDFWFKILGFPVLRVAKAVPNIASRRISEKQGMRVIATMERNYLGGRFPAELWELTAEEWNRRKAEIGTWPSPPR
jgi:[ribosomal protein S5]-alanine N-acetyltransferase